MTEAQLTWSIWQALLNAFAGAFTRRGFHRFADWITAMALNVEEHTITQSVLALEQPAAWKALESFAEYGSRHQDRVTQALTRLIATAPGRIWYGYQVSAVDDTKVHRSSPHVWGTCTFHESTARCPNRALHRSRRQLGGPGRLAPRTRIDHAINRGNNRADVLGPEGERDMFLGDLARTKARYPFALRLLLDVQPFPSASQAGPRAVDQPHPPVPDRRSHLAAPPETGNQGEIQCRFIFLGRKDEPTLDYRKR